MQSNGGSKKRTYNQFNAQNQKDNNMLFGANEDANEAPIDDAGYDNEAQEDDDDFLQDEEIKSEEEGEGVDLDENAEQDYQQNEQLDQYDHVGIDDAEQMELEAAQRREVERKLDYQQRQQARGQLRAPDAFMDDDELSETNLQARQARREAQLRMQGLEEEGDYDNADLGQVNDYSDSQGKLSAWLQKKEVRFFVRRKFGNFLRTFKDDKQKHVYESRIQEMCQNNKQSIEVNFTHLSGKQPTLAIWLAEEPAYMLPVLNEVASETVQEIYPEYLSIHPEIYVRVRDLPVEDKLRDLRQVHLNALIKFKGVVTKRTGVFPQFQKMYFRCSCGDIKGPMSHASVNEARQYLGACVICRMNGPYVLDEVKTVYRNYQKLTIQETPGSVPPGRVPRQKECFVLHDLVDTARPGDEVEITGIYINMFDYFQNVKHGFPIFQTIVEVNNLKRQGDEDVIDLTDDDKHEIRRLSKQPDIAKKIITSIAPSIYGHEFIKKSLALAMFGGESKDVGGRHRIRGDINCLLLGDPGTAKSQFLKYVEQVYHRVVYTTGKGASAVGLTAGVHKDPITGEWTLEGGALVLADKGLCLIDEFDKMNDSDRTSIHEAMEQQSISISKAGIVTSLQARCSVIAAANPIGGVYRVEANFNDNVDLTDPILSRFDILSVIRDEANEEIDDALATFVINSHMKNHPRNKKKSSWTQETEDQVQAILKENCLDESRIQQVKTENQIPQDILSKYIIYAKKFVHPKLNEIDKEKVTSFYAAIRRESSVVGGIPIAVRHIESVIRMSEAYAKIHLRDYVRSDDIDFAIDMMLSSFCQSQKASVGRQLGIKLKEFKMKDKSDANQYLKFTLERLCNQKALYEKMRQQIEDIENVNVEITVQHFESEVPGHLDKLQNFFKSALFTQKYTLDEANQKIRTQVML